MFGQNINSRKLEMWQSHVEIEGYSIAYFDRIAAFKAPIAEFPLRAGLICAL